MFRAPPAYLRTMCADFDGSGFRVVALGYQPGSYAAGWRATRKAVRSAKPPVFVYGESVGGTLAGRAALELDVDGAAVVSAPTNLITWRRDAAAYWDRIGMSRAARRRASPALQRVPRRHPPVFVAHGRRDDLVSIAQSNRFAKRLGTHVVRLRDGHLVDPTARTRAGRWFSRRTTRRN